MVGTPKWLVCKGKSMKIRKSQSKMDDLGVPPVVETLPQFVSPPTPSTGTRRFGPCHEHVPLAACASRPGGRAMVPQVPEGARKNGLVSHWDDPKIDGI